MPRIKNLHEVLKTEKPEDQCTNFLFWLLEKLPHKILSEICTCSQLSINSKCDFTVKVQYPLEDSRPDAVIEFQDGKHLVVETKLFPNSFKEDQFCNHYRGGISEFGADNTFLLFLSGDLTPPPPLETLRLKFSGRIGFISWRSLLQILEESKSTLPSGYEIVLDEFFHFAQHIKLGRYLGMNTEELTRFMDVYPFVEEKKASALEIFKDLLKELTKRIIAECEESVMEQDEIETKSLPNLYCSLRIKGWHTDYSAYLFINVVLKKFGFVLVGYQDEMNRKEKSAFFERWNNSFKAKYKEDNNLKAFSFIGKDEDENAINAGYFKIIEGMSGKLFNPEQISDFQDNFYWGYSYDFKIAEKNSYFENIPKDFKKLLDCFLTPDPSEKRRTKN